MGLSNEFYIVVDVETAGPNPSSYAMLSIGAVCLSDMDNHFYIEMKPDKIAFTEEALRISHLSMESLAQFGLRPQVAMRKFAEWVEASVPPQAHPVLAAFNAPFDWMFINDYLYRYLGNNPFGHSALDIKAYYMGYLGISWAETSFRVISQHYPKMYALSHNALEDALSAANLLRSLMAEREEARNLD